MTDEFDQLKAFQKEARTSLSTQHKNFVGLDQLREFQKQVREAEEAGIIVKRARRPKSKTKTTPERKHLTPQAIEAIKADKGPAKEVAERFGVTQATVYRYRPAKSLDK